MSGKNVITAKVKQMEKSCKEITPILNVMAKKLTGMKGTAAKRGNGK